MKPMYIKISFALLGITALLSLPFTQFSALADHSRSAIDYQPAFPVADFDFNLTMVGQYGGPSYAVAVEGDHVTADFGELGTIAVRIAP